MSDIHRSAFRAVRNWSREYFELQHSTALGRAFTELMEVLESIACPPEAAENEDRFDCLKRLEERVDQALAQLGHACSARRSHPAGRTLEDADSPPVDLFVYGTLKRGLSRSFALAGQTFVSEARTQPKYRMLDCGGYPGLVSASVDGRSVRGEVWRVDPQGLRKLDEIEGVSLNLYRREPVELEGDWGRVEAYFYARSADAFPDAGDCW